MVTIIIMEAFINKMRRLKGVRKQLIVEEAWKALSTANMAEYLRYMYKTVRKYYGEAIVVTQEVEDIISSPVVKEAIINNSDCKILLDQRKFMNRFDAIQSLLGLTDKEKAQILSVGNLFSRRYRDGHLEPSLITRLTTEGRHLVPDHLPGNPVDGRGPHRLVQPRPGHTPHTRPPLNGNARLNRG